jgi:hypothetical protein
VPAGDCGPDGPGIPPGILDGCPPGGLPEDADREGGADGEADGEARRDDEGGAPLLPLLDDWLPAPPDEPDEDGGGVDWGVLAVEESLQPPAASTTMPASATTNH